ncbi:hypothetical protein [Reinekea sp. G2M2-21]|uniref:hypothetical protein n=1 Tax=Reinekea sp. G2M2-21 TaxID=2788942 RepID=UPI0018AA9A1E|nr:hypothetical protein [Reinekea sp. G2M2-21]
MKFFVSALLSLLAVTAFLLTTHSSQGNEVLLDSAQGHHINIEPVHLIPLGSEIQNERDDISRSHIVSDLKDSSNNLKDATQSTEQPINVATLEKTDINSVIIEPTPDNADLLATGEFADQVNLQPLPCSSDCADDWDEFAPATGEYSNQVNLYPSSIEEELPEDVDLESHPSTVTGSYIDG